MEDLGVDWMMEYRLTPKETIRRREVTRGYKRWASIELPDWEDAACKGADPELFFIERYQTHKIPLAKKICAGCPIRVQCLNYAIKYKMPYGVWGGATMQERERFERVMYHG